jgi:MFS family permease
MLKRVSFYLGISVFWLPLSMLYDGINTLVLPSGISSFVDENQQASTLGLLSFVGLLAGLLAQPIAGAISDNWRSRIGRKGFLVVGVALTLVFLALFGLSGSLVVLAAGYLLVQVSASIIQAAQQGFIPDLVPAASRGKASGWKAFMDIGGATIGFVLLGEFLGGGQAGLAAATIGLGLVAALVLTVFLVRERRTPRQALEERNAAELAPIFVEAFRLDFKKHRLFAWLVVSRFLFLLGTYAVGRFLLYYIASRLGLGPNEAAQQAGSLLAALALATALGAPFAGWVADRWRRLPVILFGSLISASGVFLLIFASSLAQIFLFGMMMSLGSAAFASANWALTADLVPKEESARYFGLANIGTAGAAATAGLFGPLVDWANTIRPGAGFPALFIASAAALALSALVLRWMDKTIPTEQSESASMYI